MLRTGDCRIHAERSNADEFTFGLDVILDGLECARGLPPGSAA
jgi:hypothetical protein